MVVKRHSVRSQILFLTFLFLLCSTVAIASSPGQQVVQRNFSDYQQPIQNTPVYPSQAAPVYPSQYPNQIINGQIINGQPVQGRIINGQIIYGQYGIQNTITPGSILPGQPTPATPSNNEANAKQALELKRLTDENNRLNELALGNENLKREYERLQSELKRANTELVESRNKLLSPGTSNSDALIRENEELKQSYKSLQIEFSKTNEELVELRKKPTQTPDSRPDMTAMNVTMRQQQNQIVELTERYEQSTQQNNTLTEQLRTVTNENANVKSELSELKALNPKMDELQTKYSGAMTNMNELEQTNEAMAADNSRILALIETAKADNVGLTDTIATLKFENSKLKTKVSSSPIKVSSDSTNAKMKMTSLRKKVNPKSRLRPNLNSNQESLIEQLETQNRNLINSNEQANAKNELLTQRISQLEGSVSQLTTGDGNPKPQLSNGISTLPKLTENKYSIKSWLLPFLATGLAIGLYVFLSEEFRGTSKTKVHSGSGKTRD